MVVFASLLVPCVESSGRRGSWGRRSCLSDEIGGIVIKTGKYKKVGLDTITRISIVEWGRFAKRERGKNGLLR